VLAFCSLHHPVRPVHPICNGSRIFILPSRIRPKTVMLITSRLCTMQNRTHNLTSIARGDFPCILFLAFLSAGVRAQPVPEPAARPQASEPTFQIFKYQHAVGKEVDDCKHEAAATHCHAHFQLDFTGSSISLDANIQTGAAFQPILYSAKGRNSTRSFVDLEVSIDGQQGRVIDNGLARSVALPSIFFTLQQNVPVITQELLFGYWQAHGHPARIALLPEGEVRIRPRGAMKITGSSAETLTRYSVHGVTWGDETVWLSGNGEIAAVVGGDAEEDRIEIVRPRYATRLKDFANQAAADAVADLESAMRGLKPTASGTYALTHATVINPAGDAAPQHNVTLLVSGGKLTAVGADLNTPPGTTIVDLAGKFVLPGLWDTHAHFEQWEWGPACLASGITTVRDVGNEIEFLVPIRQSLNSGRGLGPYMHAAGLIDSDPGSLTSEHAEDAGQARFIVQRYHELGYEQIKIYQSLKPELIPVVAAEAHRLGMTVTGHIPTGTDALNAVRNGMDQINHISFVARVMRPQGSTAIRAESEQARTALGIFLEHHTVVEPTLARGEYNGHPRRCPFGDLEASASFLPPPLALILNNAGVTEDREQRAVVSLQTALHTTKILYDAGIPILAGSDQVVPGFSIHRELELLVRAGLSPLQAIRTATTIPAKIFGISDIGAIEAGKRADLLVLDANPLDDISNIRRVYLTITAGTAFQPNPLRQVAGYRPWP
jgi:imidazolonepropionase-like amidohydrolase